MKSKTNKIFKLVGLLIAIIIVLLIFLYITKLYPVAIVNGDYITARNYEVNLDVAVNYAKGIAGDKAENQEMIESVEFKKETQRSVLESLVEARLISDYLDKTIKAKDLKAIIENKIKNAIGGKDVAKGIAKLYKLSVSDFEKLVLIPQAKYEIIEGRFMIENKNFSEWIKEAKQTAKTTIYISGFKWGVNGVETN